MKKDWEIKKLGELVTQINGLWKGKKEPFINVAVIRNTNFSKDCKLKLDDVEYLDVEIKQYSSRKLQFGDIIIEKSGGSDKQPVGRPILFDIEDGEYSFSNFTSTLRIKDVSQVSAEYLQQYLYFRWLNGDTRNLQSHTTGIHNLDFKAYLNFEIPLPPLSEQKRIVKILDKKFAQIETLKTDAEKNLQNTKQLFQAELEKAFSNKSWEKKRLGDLSTEKMSYGSSSPSCNYNGEIRYIRITDINDNGFLNEEFVSPKNYEKKHILKDGDIVFARTGATVGKAFCYNDNDGKCVYAGYLIRLRPNRELVIPEFIYLNTKSKEYEDFIKNSQAAAAQPNVNAEKYSNFEIPLPPLEEQKRIVAHLDSLSEKVHQLEEIYTKQLADCDELKQAYLAKAFEGEL